MESCASNGAADKMEVAGQNRTQVLRDLYELVEALDRRVPRIQRAGELSIARASAALRVKAFERIRELEREPDETRL